MEEWQTGEVGGDSGGEERRCGADVEVMGGGIKKRNTCISEIFNYQICAYSLY